MSVTLARHVALETIAVEQFLTVDGEGAPTYQTPVDIQARVLRQEKITVGTDGSRTRTVLTVWVPPGETVIPDERARLEWESTFFIVTVVKDVKNRDATLEHRRVRCRRE